MSIHVHQLLVWYMTNKHAAGCVGLFKGPETEALKRRGSFSCPGVRLCQPRRQHSLAWVRSALSNMWWHTHVRAHQSTHARTRRHTEYMRMQIYTWLLLCCHHVEMAWHIFLIGEMRWDEMRWMRCWWIQIKHCIYRLAITVVYVSALALKCAIKSFVFFLLAL